ncbi:hypothetical protein [Streptomyces sp. A5-4]|uniref:hypothetical protein n=1 Tax=Streptomyces sp. A5-4 TaxID=3384771 RepID=UPI003DAA0B3F
MAVAKPPPSPPRRGSQESGPSVKTLVKLSRPAARDVRHPEGEIHPDRIVRPPDDQA